MILDLPSGVQLWEAVAAIQVAQAHRVGDMRLDLADQEMRELIHYAQIAQWGSSTGVSDALLPQVVTLATDKAYRQVASAKRPYPNVLATASGLEEKVMQAPRFPAFIPRSERSGIIVCPFEAHDSFKMPWTVWKALLRHLTSYGLPVQLLGRPGQRADYSPFTEGSILSDRQVEEKLQALSQAHLVVGVPNEWTWIASGFSRKIIVMHPDDMPHERWFGYEVEERTLGRLLVTWGQLQIPVILAGMRRLIDAM